MYLCRLLEAARLNHNVTLRRKRESMTMSKESEVFISVPDLVSFGAWLAACTAEAMCL